MAQGLVSEAPSDDLLCRARGGPAEELVDGVRFVRRGSKLTVYQEGFRPSPAPARRVDLVVDVQNGLPFFNPRRDPVPVVVLVHHVHREQWPWSTRAPWARSGGRSEHRLAPRLYRSCQYVAVSRATRDELVPLGVDRAASRWCTTAPTRSCRRRRGSRPTPRSPSSGAWSPTSRWSTPSTRRWSCAATTTDLRLHVVGSGWGRPSCTGTPPSVARRHDRLRGPRRRATQARGLRAAWALALPSLKEGWAWSSARRGCNRTPTVAYASAGGTRESVRDGVSGVLVDRPDELTSALGAVVSDPALRARLGEGARRDEPTSSPGVTRRSRSPPCWRRSCAASASTPRTRTAREARPGRRPAGPASARGAVAELRGVDGAGRLLRRARLGW